MLLENGDDVVPRGVVRTTYLMKYTNLHEVCGSKALHHSVCNIVTWNVSKECWSFIIVITLWHGSVFCVTLWEKYVGHRWITLTKASNIMGGEVFFGAGINKLLNKQSKPPLKFSTDDWFHSRVVCGCNYLSMISYHCEFRLFCFQPKSPRDIFADLLWLERYRTTKTGITNACETTMELHWWIITSTDPCRYNYLSMPTNLVHLSWSQWHLCWIAFALQVSYQEN